jgi:acid phosphatase type 7
MGLMLTVLLFSSASTDASAPYVERNTLVPPGYREYLPGPAPDRIILLATESPARSQTVNWRTGHAVAMTAAQIVEASASVGLHLDAAMVTGSSTLLGSENGLARHHQVTFDNLQPDTLYAYRVRGQDTWSEWLQFRSAREDGEDFSFLYFGDAQNSVKSHFSRVIREASAELPRPALMLHAGDLVNLREGIHDDEWGEWFDAGAFLYAMTPNIVVAGNHEHVNHDDDDGNRQRVLSEHFRAQYTVPDNGPEDFADTVYYIHYQNTLFVVLDSTQALEDAELAKRQAEWLDAVLTDNTSRWVIISHHHPVFSVSLGRDNPILREYWKPVYDRHRVDLVLQGHDHTYGRGDNVAEGATLVDGQTGTVYVVSVAGPKMYLVSDEARQVTGAVYDAFDIVRNPDGYNRLVERTDDLQSETVCGNPEPSRETRCWDGKELVN